MAIEFKDGKYVDPQTGRVTLDPTVYKDWQIAEEAEKNLPPVDYFREKLGLLPEEIIPYGKTPKIDFIKVMKRVFKGYYQDVKAIYNAANRGGARGRELYEKTFEVATGHKGE